MRKFFALLLLLICLYTGTALACSCVEGAFGPEASRANIESAAMIFEGELLDVMDREFERKFTKNPKGPVSPDKNPSLSRVALKITDLYKGQPAEHALAYFDTETMCGTPVKEGDTGLYVLSEYMGALVAADHCSSYITPADLRALRNGDYKTGRENAFADVVFPDIFETEEDLKAWAEASTFGGGQAEEIHFQGLRLMAVFRSHTSGRVTSDLALYIANKDGSYVLKRSHPPVYDTINAVQDGENLIFIMNTSRELLLEETLYTLVPGIIKPDDE